MNIDYLKNTVSPQREKEMQDGKHLGTRNPIYIVYDMVEQIISDHNEFTITGNMKGLPQEFGYIDLNNDVEEREFYTEKKSEKCEPVTRFFIDRLVAVFFTSKAAHDYIQYQKHNLSERAYVYVHSIGYRNQELQKIFNDE